MRRAAPLAAAAAAVVAAMGAPAGGAAVTGADLERLAAAHAPGPAAPASTYTDPSGDNERLGPDIVGAVVSNDPGGFVSVRIDVPNVPQLRAGHFFALFLDTDARRTTGSESALGAEYAIAFDGATGTTDLARWTSGRWNFDVASTTLRAVWSSGASVSVHRNELGGTSGLSFWAGATWTSDAGTRYGDVAPDAGVWSYALTGLDATAPRGPALDATAPRVRAVHSTGRHGQRVRLRYRVSDGSGETRERVLILRRGRVVAALSTGFARSDARTLYFAQWRAPRRAASRYRFCVEAWDRAGNASGVSCATLVLRRR